MKRKLLYISSNDGSDTRINKELQTLSRQFDITYVGVGLNNRKNFGAVHCKYFHLVIGRRHNPYTLLKMYFLLFRLPRRRYDSIHVINETLLMVFYPLLVGKHVVLDIFDSIFLVHNRSRNAWKLLKRIVYAGASRIIVTDENRKALMPAFTANKVIVLENYPMRYEYSGNRLSPADELTILYSGWLGVQRGTALAEMLLAQNASLRLIVAGWIADERSRELTRHPAVDFRGILSQEEVLDIAAMEADYILCVYAPVNENNINASPNKVYDAIQSRTPLIMNAEIRIASFIKEHDLGVIIADYDSVDAAELVRTLKERRNTFVFPESLCNTYIWERIEHKLLGAHEIAPEKIPEAEVKNG